jgi:tRNA(adenine34) deaminase
MGINDTHWMLEALQCAKIAEKWGEVPIGAVVVKDNTLVATGWNCPITERDPSAHAEIKALRAAGNVLNNYRLVGCTLYVTLEPCDMCWAALVHARVDRVVFGASNPKEKIAHKPLIQGGMLEEACSLSLKQFFQEKR